MFVLNHSPVCSDHDAKGSHSQSTASSLEPAKLIQDTLPLPFHCPSYP